MAPGTSSVAEAEMMHMLAHFLQPAAKGVPGPGWMNWISVEYSLTKVAHFMPGIFAAGELVVFHDALFQRLRVEDSQDFGPVLDRFVQVFDQHANMGKRAARHD